MMAVEKQNMVKNALQRLCKHTDCEDCEFFNPDDKTDGFLWCAIRDKDRKPPSYKTWDMESAMGEVAEEHNNGWKTVVNEEIKNPFVNISTVGCVNCEHKDEYIIELEEDNNCWIPCSERMPEEHDSMFAKLKGTDRWCNGMFAKASDIVIVTVMDKNGDVTTTYSHTTDGKWSCGLLKMNTSYQIIAWQPLPEPCQIKVESANWKDAVMRTFTNTEESNYG